MPSGNLGREFYVRELQQDIPVDVYGDCGDYKCPKVRESRCREDKKNMVPRFCKLFHSATELAKSVLPSKIHGNKGIMNHKRHSLHPELRVVTNYALNSQSTLDQ